MSALRFLLPWHSFAVDSAQPPAMVAALMASQVAPRRWFDWSADGKPFQGDVDASRFQVTRVILYRNSFLPVVNGCITAHGAGSHVRVTMRLPVYAAVFMLAWIGLLGRMAVIPLAESLADGSAASSPARALGPAIMVVFGLAMTYGGFWWEAVKQEPMLRAILTAGEA